MLYFSSMPIIYLFVYVSLVFLYWVAKYNFLRMSCIPPKYAHAMNELGLKILLLGLAINAFVSPLYYTHLNGNIESTTFESLLRYWYYLLTLIIIIFFGFLPRQTTDAYFFMKNFILNCLG